MSSSTSARKLHLVDRLPESERESGIHSAAHARAALVTTAKIPKVQLDRLRQIRDERDAAIMEPRWDDEAPTLQAQAPLLSVDIPSPVEPDAFEELEEVEPDDMELPVPTPELTVVMRYQANPEPAIRISVPPPFVPIVGAPIMVGPAAIEAARLAREAVRHHERARNRTKWLVIAIWTTAFALAGGLAWVIGHDHLASPAPIVTE